MSAAITVSASDGSANALAYAIGARRRDIEQRVAVAERRGAAAIVREYLREDALLGAVAQQLDAQMVALDRAEREQREDIEGLDTIPVWMLGMPLEQD